MKRLLTGLGLLASLCVGAVTHVAAPAGAQSPPPPVKPGKPAPAKPTPPAKTPGACVQVSGGTRMEPFGFTHVVTLRNGCDKPISCEVWTDVDPTPRQALNAEPGETVEVVTRIGAPGSAVTAFKECRYR